MTLDPRQLRSQGGRNGSRQHGLPHARDILNEQVTTAESGDGRRGNGVPRPEQDLGEVFYNRLTDGDRTIEVMGLGPPDVMGPLGPSGLDGKVQDPSLH